jgi:hypothetical protein
MEAHDHGDRKRLLFVLAGLLAIATIWAMVRGVGEDAPAVSDAIAAEIAQDRAFARHRVILRWSAPEPGSTYSIVVDDEDRRRVASGERLAEPVFRVPADAVFAVPGDRLIWEVTATLPDGRRLRSRSFVALLQ